MDAISSVLIAKALDGLSMRQMFSAQNIANANTPGYKAIEVTFEKSLKLAAGKGIESIENLRPKTQYAQTASGSTEMRLDMELAKASQTAMRYGALIDVLGRQMALARTVVSGGQ
ncbi:flagellar basal body rod protein FlgB [Fretibacter rubidus]|uniref:flagellar basal body rod protein FlgB n=1 Tax=Fretibacter rubidus TaxID=570162 RepID=UPI00352B2E0A